MSEISSIKSKKSMSKSSTNLVSVPQLESGKLPPQAVDLEEAVLGAMMLERSAVGKVGDILRPESFYKESHGKVYKSIAELFEKGEPIDILTVANRMKENEDLDSVGGPFFVSQLTNRVASAANVEFYARIISQKHIQRELIRLSSEVIDKAFEDSTDVFDLLDYAENAIFQVTSGNIRKDTSQIDSVMKEALDNIQAARKNKDGVSGMPTGFTELDRITSGWQRSDMVVLAARPGMGKTAFVLSMARNMAVDFDIPVAVFSLEMSSVQLVQRLIASETEISAEKLRKGDLADHEYQQLHQRIGKLTDAHLFIDDTPSLSVFELRAKCRRLKTEHGIQMVVIDYLQLMTAGGDSRGNREQEISSISRSIKSIAKELDIPIIALSQLSRMVETRGGDRRPVLSDLRESGAIEQDADLVCFIYRPEYYGMTEDSEGNSNAGVGELIIAKHRNGALGSVKLRFVGRLAKFTNWDSFEEGATYGNSLQPNTEFEQMPTITVSSKLNTMTDDEGDGRKPIGDVSDDAPPF
jgi:replicative DNA helicase